MANLILPPSWALRDRDVTPESSFFNRRRFLKQFGLTGGGAALAASTLGLAPTSLLAQDKKPGAAASAKGFPAKRNPDFSNAGKLTDERVAGIYNNFYEFSTQKNRVHRLVDKFIVEPWPLQVYGLCENPITLDIQEFAEKFSLEERIYRFRCVEAWAMIVPWTGFQLSKLLEFVKPKAEAKFVRFETALRPDQMPGLARLADYPWPYTEGLRLDEAMNPLTLLATGIYGKPMPKQHGAPVRLVVPWKYGYKSIKSIVKIELVAKQPATLWESLAPREYPFESNVDPAVPHPRWSQAHERMIDTEERVPTQKYNGYASAVSHLYAKKTP